MFTIKWHRPSIPSQLDSAFCFVFCECRYTTKVLEHSPGEEAGIKMVSLEVHGWFAYGFLSSENGTHRLVRQSPFKKAATRQTSFAAVEVSSLAAANAATGLYLPPATPPVSPNSYLPCHALRHGPTHPFPVPVSYRCPRFPSSRSCPSSRTSPVTW